MDNLFKKKKKNEFSNNTSISPNVCISLIKTKMEFFYFLGGDVCDVRDASSTGASRDLVSLRYKIDRDVYIDKNPLSISSITNYFLFSPLWRRSSSSWDVPITCVVSKFFLFCPQLIKIFDPVKLIFFSVT